MSLSQIEADLKAQVSRSVCIEKDDRGQHYIATPFAFADGDEPVIALVPNGKGWVLSDFGNTLLRLSYRLDEDEYDSPDTQSKLDAAVAMAQITKQGGRLTRALPEGEYAYALFEFAYALMRIDELGHIDAPQSRAASQLSRPRFKDEVKELVTQVIPPDRVELDWHDPQWDSGKEYAVDCRINGMPTPLFLHALGTNDNTRDTTIVIYRFREQSVPGRHIAIFRDERKIAKQVKSRLNAVCHTTFASLETERPRIIDFLEHDALS